MDLLTECCICHGGLVEDPVFKIERIEPEIIEERDGCPLWDTEPFTHRFEDILDSLARLNVGPAVPEHREGMGVAAGHLRETPGIPDLDIRGRFRSVQ
jgi:hypothetical protein